MTTRGLTCKHSTSLSWVCGSDASAGLTSVWVSAPFSPLQPHFPLPRGKLSREAAPHLLLETFRVTSAGCHPCHLDLVGSASLGSHRPVFISVTALVTLHCKCPAILSFSLDWKPPASRNPFFFLSLSPRCLAQRTHQTGERLYIKVNESQWNKCLHCIFPGVHLNSKILKYYDFWWFYCWWQVPPCLFFFHKEPTDGLYTLFGESY